MNATTVIGYAYEGAIYCDPCAAERFGRCACDQQDVHGVDGEGNEVHAVFANDEQAGDLHCDRCGGSLMPS